MHPSFSPLALSSLALLLLATVALSQGGIVADRIDSTSTHLTLNVIPQTDTQEADFAVGDVDLDGDLDVVVGRKLPFTTNGARINLLLINQDGALTDMTASLTSWVGLPYNTRDIELADMDNDGWPDVIEYNSENNPTIIWLNLGNDVAGNWQGFATTPVTSIGPTGGAATWNFCAGTTLDYDLDGRLDIFRVAYSSAQTNDLLRQDPAAPLTFIPMTSLVPTDLLNTGFGTTAWTKNPDGSMLDLNADGFVDGFLAGSGSAEAFMTDGLGGILGSQQLEVSATYAGIVGDFNGDGLSDFCKVNDGTDFVNLNGGPDGSGGFIELPGVNLPNSSGFGANPKVGDLDGDGDLDIGVCPIDVDANNCTTPTGLKIYANDGSGGFTLSHTFPHPAFDVVFADFDGDNKLDILLCACSGAQPGYRLFLTDPSAALTSFEHRFIAQPGGSEFKVRNIPQPAGASLTLYNLFSTVDHQPVGSGPLIGLDIEVITQIGINFAPFRVQVPSGTTEYSLALPVLPGLGFVQSRGIAVDPVTSQIFLSDIWSGNIY